MSQISQINQINSDRNFRLPNQLKFDSRFELIYLFASLDVGDICSHQVADLITIRLFERLKTRNI